jgi:hypothetical protein
MATWGDSRAEDRLLTAIVTREYGFDDEPEAARPEKNVRVVPHWLAAVTVLRNCSTARCLPVLQAVAAEPNLALNVRTAIAITLERLARRGVQLPTAAMQTLLETLLAGPVPGALVTPQRSVYQTLQGESAGPAKPTAEDHSWQLHLAVAKARIAAGLDPQPQAAAFVNDDRALVRAAFAALPTAVAAGV